MDYIAKVKFAISFIGVMNSLTLKERGFAEFVSLKGLAYPTLPLDKSSVIVLSDSTSAGKPASDILYIGKSKKPAKRIFGGYLSGYGGKNTRRIHSMLSNDGVLEKISVSWMETENPKIAQQELESFKKEHGQYPAWNTLKPKAKAQPKSKVTKKVARPRRPRKTN